MTSRYNSFPVIETIELRDASDIRSAVDRMIEAYAKAHDGPLFSYRILLPRGERLTGKAKKIGVAFQGEFLLGLRKKKMTPKVRELRYLHDEDHYGWLLASPQVFEQFDKKAAS